MTHAFAIKDPEGNILVSTVKQMKSECIKAFAKGANMDWKEIKTYGWTCIKIEIIEVK